MPFKVYPELIRPIIYIIGPSICYVELTQKQYACIEIEDAAYVSQWNWHARWNGHTRSYYAVRWDSPTKHHVKMHTDLFGVSGVDHKNPRYTLDNRRHGNLRAATDSENSANRRMRSDNTSGFKGVSEKRPGVYQAYIYKNGKRYHLGYRRSAEEAAKLYHIVALEIFGEFARFE